MASSMSDTFRELLINSIESATKNLEGSHDATPSPPKPSGVGAKGLIAGLGMAVVAPAAVKGLGRLAREAGMNGVTDLVRSPGEAVEGLAGNVGSKVEGKVGEKLDQAGGPSGILSGALKGALPFGGGDDDETSGKDTGGVGIGKGRRMPVQQSVDIAAPLETVYNQWTQFEDWPKFMHRVVGVTQDDETTVNISVKIWSRKREFTAHIETQRPDDRIRWVVSQGITHAGLVSFHEIAPNLTRVMLSLDVEPGGMIEKMARGMRHVKRAARGDLHRFKAYIELAERESGAWRGTIEDGEVVEEHDPSYDDEHDYADPEEVVAELKDAAAQDEDDDHEEDDQDDDDQDDGSARAEDDDSEDEDEDAHATRAPRRRRRSSNGHGRDDDGSSTRSRARSSRSGSRSKSAAGSRNGRK